MTKNNLLQTLDTRVEDYRRSHPSTAEMDIAIFKKSCKGKTAVQISMEIPCSESTVYRALHRVRSFIRTSDLDSFMDTLQECITQHNPNFGEGNARSVLEMLHIAYRRFNHFESPESKAGYTELYSKLSSLPLQSTDQVVDIVSSLCHSYERDGFTEGLKLGVRMGNELNT